MLLSKFVAILALSLPLCSAASNPPGTTVLDTPVVPIPTAADASLDPSGPGSSRAKGAGVRRVGSRRANGVRCMSGAESVPSMLEEGSEPMSSPSLSQSLPQSASPLPTSPSSPDSPHPASPSPPPSPPLSSTHATPLSDHPDNVLVKEIRQVHFKHPTADSVWLTHVGRRLQVNYAEWEPSPGVESDLWLIPFANLGPNGTREGAVRLERDMGGHWTGISNPWQLPTGRNFVLQLTVSGKADKAISTSPQFHINAPMYSGAVRREWGPGWASIVAASIPASYVVWG